MDEVQQEQAQPVKAARFRRTDAEIAQGLSIEQAKAARCAQK